MKQFFSPSYISAGFVAILVGYTSAAAIVFQAAIAAGATPDQVSSWMWALGVAMGVMGIALSVYYRHPIMIAWSTPGAALMVTSLPGIAYSDAIGAFLFCSLLITICGLTGWFDKIMKLIPQSLATAMLAGVLLQFAFKIFPAFETETLIVAAMLVTYILAKWMKSTYAIPLTFAIGVILALMQGKIDMGDITLEVTTPVWTTPTFDISVLIGIGLPLFIVTMASQNVPGIAALRAHGYQTPASPLIGWTGAMGLAFAPFGGYAYNMAAITAALCMSEDVHPDPKQRYYSTIWVGIFYLLAGIFGATVAGFFTAFPQALVGAIAGLALLGTIANSLHGALEDTRGREAAILTFVITASGGTFLTIGAPFWGLVIGLIVYLLNQRTVQRG
ncbi:benzoate/H(+) symporter BenE family transporter [Terasakiella sp. A23]|uniref:benzoate/H(+) symporter BenE family transporter n=1 Tax=Terasakiella sp. FCG-A23 TaxID=3080561 RepID=UPI002955552F|nr:benzoate/H(+) symporter BenE family transporter [Terasakiella sp. A23]MDV7338104.1 benzoate/H(+) symporter BenE family transporter [Terasakiella sp. A23]